MVRAIQFIFSFILCINLITGYSANCFSPITRNYTTKDGLPSSQIYQTHQDKEGFMWFVSDNGISRFDGNQFKNFTFSTGICVRSIFGIFEEEDKRRLWFYSYSGKLIYFDYADMNMHCPSFNQKLESYTRGSILNGLFIQGDTIYTYNYNADIFKIDQKSGSVSVEKNNYNHLIRSYSEKHFIVGHKAHHEANCRLNLSLLNSSTSSIKMPSNTYSKKNSPSIPTHAFDSLNNRLYFNSHHGIITTDLVGQTARYYSQDYTNTQSYFLDREGLLWIGYFNKGVIGYDLSNGGIKEVFHLLNEYSITSIEQDRDGGYWFSSHQNGVFYIPNLKAECISEINDTIFNSRSRVTSLKKDNSSLFFSNAKGEIIKISDAGEGVAKLVGIESRNFVIPGVQNGEYLRSDYSIWKDGLMFTNGSFKGSLTVNEIDYFIYRVNSKYKVYSRSNSHIEEIFSKESSIRAREVQLTYKLNLYVGSNSSLQFYNKELDQWFEVGTEEGYSNRIDVAHIAPISGDSAWISTRNMGLLLVHKDRILKIINSDNGIPFTYCNHVYSLNSLLFVSTNSGLFRINPEDRGISFKRLNENHGLISNEVFSSLIIGNYLYAATNEGLCKVDTSLFYDLPIKPNCIIELVELDGDQVSINDQIRVPYSVKGIKINYTSPTYQNAFKIPYRYRLTTNDKWIYTNDKELILSNLAPSEYNFEIQAGGPYDDWGKSSFLNFTIEAAFWQTSWFQVAVVLLIIILALLISNIRVKNAKRISSLQTALIKSQNKALSAQMNPHFIFNSLNSISHGLLHQDMRSSISYIGKFGKLMRTIFENSEATFITIEEELKALKNYMDLEKLRLGDRLDYIIYLDEEIPSKSIYIPTLLLQPFVENAIWHGIAPLEEGGTIILFISTSRDNLKIRIEDNGVGYNSNSSLEKRKNSALRTTQKRLDLIKQLYKRKIEFSIEAIDPNSNKKGTRFSLNLPLITQKPELD